jgi:8-oxoguanine deaminase
MVAGEWKVKNGEMVDVDINDVMARYGIEAKRLQTMT